MDTYTIYKVLKSKVWIRDIFCGVYPINLLPTKLVKPCLFIVNTDQSNLPGQHWFTIHINEKSNCFIFDSFGKIPQNNYLYKFLKYNCTKIYYNSKLLQNVFSPFCGQYCVVFVAFIARGYKYEDFFNLFSNNTLYNDDLINNLYLKIFK